MTILKAGTLSQNWRFFSFEDAREDTRGLQGGGGGGGGGRLNKKMSSYQ